MPSSLHSMDKPSLNRRRRWKIALVVVACIIVFDCIIGILLYQPLPDKLCSNSFHDRFLMHFIEPILRVVYLYPGKLCGNALCSLRWTNGSLGVIAAVTNPWFGDGQLNITTTTMNNVTVRVYSLKDSSSIISDGGVVYIHGGGYAISSVEAYDGICRELTKRIRPRLLVSVSYRLGPSTIFLGAIDDCEAVVDYLMENGRAEYGIDPAKLVVMGDSAGGHAASVLAHRFSSSRKKNNLLGQALIYPVVQALNLRTSSYIDAANYSNLALLLDPAGAATSFLVFAGIDMERHTEYIDALLQNGHVSDRGRSLSHRLFSSLNSTTWKDWNRQMANSPTKVNGELANQLDPFILNPDFSPLLRESLSGLPSALVVTCQFDVLRDEGILYSERLRAAGIPTTHIHFENAFHGILNIYEQLDLGTEMLQTVANWTAELLVSSA